MHNEPKAISGGGRPADTWPMADASVEALAHAGTWGGLPFGALWQDLCCWLQRCYPYEARATIEDAAADALVVLLEQLANAAHPGDGLDATEPAAIADPESILRVVAWRRLRAGWRDRKRRGELLADHLAPDTDGRSPERIMLSRHALEQLDAQVWMAARRVAGRGAPRLAAALRDRLHSGEADGLVARRHGLRREQLMRARQWVLTQVAPEVH